MTSLTWLPEIEAFRPRLRAVALQENPWAEAVSLAASRLDFVRTNALDEALRRAIGTSPPAGLSTKPVRLAILGSSTLAHLHAAIRVAGLRRGIHITTYENDYGQYQQELTDPGSALHEFRPNLVLFALDAWHLTAGLSAGMDEAAAAAALEGTTARILSCWQAARAAFQCPILQQTALPVHPCLLGNNEHLLPGSPAAFIPRLNAELRRLAAAEGVHLLAIDDRAARDGLRAWHDPVLWHRAKQEVSPVAAPMYGDLVGRIIAALQGRAAKCLVLDLDNTLWGGVVGDDGLAGLVLGQGSALGEAFVGFQTYARDLTRRGIILAVCSKNAQELNIGLDALVFVDDNPFERALVRQELPMVAVPEIGDDPTFYAQTVSDAGYFESLAITDEDRVRSSQYQDNRQRDALKASATDLPTYLRGLDMRLIWRRFDDIGLQRTVQLINKTNQFNLTTARYTEDDVLAIMRDPRAFGLQLRLLDRFGDNGIIAILIGRLQDNNDLLIDTWLMSCRVLGRQVEPTTLNLLAQQATLLGARRLIGTYRPTAKNAMVKDHYPRLGFTTETTGDTGITRHILDLTGYKPAETFIDVQEG
jgi:FkbH-like protein